MIVLSCERKISTMAHVGGRLKCLPQPNRNVWSGALSRAQWGKALELFRGHSEAWHSFESTVGHRYVQTNIEGTVEQSRQSRQSAGTILRAQ